MLSEVSLWKEGHGGGAPTVADRRVERKETMYTFQGVPQKPTPSR